MNRTEFYSRQTINLLLSYWGETADRFIGRNIREYSDKELMFEENDGIAVRYSRLFHYMDSEVLEYVLFLAVTVYKYPEVGEMIEALNKSELNLDFVVQLMDFGGTEYEYPEYEQFKKISQIFLISDSSDNYMYQTIKADRRLMMYLSDEDLQTQDYRGFVRIALGQRDYLNFGRKEQTARLAGYIDELIKEGQKGYIQISGSKGSGRKTLLRTAADMAEHNLVLLDYQRMQKGNKDEREQRLLYILREQIFYGAGLCIYDIEGEDVREDILELVFQMEKYFQEISYPTYFITLSDTQMFSATELPIIRINLTNDDIYDRIAVWKGYSKEYGIELDSEYYGARYSFTPSQVQKIFFILKYSRIERPEDIERIVKDACTEVISLPDRGSVSKESTGFSLDDLELTDRQRDILDAICSYTRDYYKVFHEWDMQKRFAYGKGMTALFVGPPGTGKTMAAGCIANEVGMPLYRVDLSQIIDKYIGETEKKLDGVFRYAQEANVVLFFDEADALFSKRSEIKDSKDKYANAEVSFILQRIEQYNGMVILASNFINNIDEAFMRRMKYVVEFQIPEAQTRKLIWEKGFARKAPLKRIDFEYLSEKIELAGGHIKNIILNASFLAAKDASDIMMKHIFMATQNEYMKLGKRIEDNFFDDY